MTQNAAVAYRAELIDQIKADPTASDRAGNLHLTSVARVPILHQRAQALGRAVDGHDRAVTRHRSWVVLVVLVVLVPLAKR
jgi:hypothetical protein